MVTTHNDRVHTDQEAREAQRRCLSVDSGPFEHLFSAVLFDRFYSHVCIDVLFCPPSTLGPEIMDMIPMNAGLWYASKTR
jgi:hypothetical protein